MWASLVTALSNLIQSKAGQWIAAILLSLGIGLATYGGIVAPGLDALLQYMQGAGNEGGQTAMQWFGLLNMDKAITMVLSAYGARATIRAGKAFLVKRG